MVNKTTIIKEIKEQQSWIEHCGGNLLGYLKRYGDPKKDKEFYGAGGYAIYEADMNALKKLQQQLKSLTAIEQ